ncbi:hypothetical protein [Albibacterium profundi]|uniref:Uncharacterized protein n=1 Tax=Albibacterium profundi TaxID=3134906 RepID=A0ABV5C9M9_9SPHI
MIRNESIYVTVADGVRDVVFSVRRSVSDFVRSNKRGILLILSLLTFIAAGDILRMVDVTAAAIDLGILAVLPLAALTVIGFLLLTEWLIAWQWPVLDVYQRYFLEKTFKQLVSWQKVLVYFSFYLALLFAFISITRAFL